MFGGNEVVQTDDGSVQRNGVRRGERVGARIESVALTETVGGGKEVEVGKGVRVGAWTGCIAGSIADLTSGIERCELAGSDGYGFARGSAYVLEYSLLISGGGHSTGNRVALGLACALVVGEEKELVLEDGTAQVAAEDVADQLARTVGLSTVQLSLFVEKVDGDRESGTVVLVGSAMKFICAGFRDETDLRMTNTPPVIGRVFVGRPMTRNYFSDDQ